MGIQKLENMNLACHWLLSGRCLIVDTKRSDKTVGWIELGDELREAFQEDADKVVEAVTDSMKRNAREFWPKTKSR